MAKKKHGSLYRKHHEHQSFLLILAGGLVVIICLYFLGWSRLMPMNQFASSDQILQPQADGQVMQPHQTMQTAMMKAQETMVSIKSYSFYPNMVTVKAGSVVTFTNNDSVAHTATIYAGTLDTGNIQPGASKTIIMRTPGTYTYKCTYHPHMTGTIIVQ